MIPFSFCSQRDGPVEREKNLPRAEWTDRVKGNWVLKEYTDILVPPIADILNTSFLECRVLRVWKVADVPPLP